MSPSTAPDAEWACFAVSSTSAAASRLALMRVIDIEDLSHRFGRRAVDGET
jgi:hypothetical protein